jgi:hypothetical protein
LEAKALGLTEANSFLGKLELSIDDSSSNRITFENILQERKMLLVHYSNLIDKFY